MPRQPVQIEPSFFPGNSGDATAARFQKEDEDRMAWLDERIREQREMERERLRRSWPHALEISAAAPEIEPTLAGNGKERGTVPPRPRPPK